MGGEGKRTYTTTHSITHSTNNSITYTHTHTHTTPPPSAHSSPTFCGNFKFYFQFEILSPNVAFNYPFRRDEDYTDILPVIALIPFSTFCPLLYIPPTFHSFPFPFLVLSYLFCFGFIIFLFCFISLLFGFICRFLSLILLDDTRIFSNFLFFFDNFMLSNFSVFFSTFSVVF